MVQEEPAVFYTDAGYNETVLFSSDAKETDIEANRFAIRIAGVTIGIKPHYRKIRNFCRQYITSEPEEMDASVSHEEIIWEQIHSDRGPSERVDPHINSMTDILRHWQYTGR